MPQQKNLTPIEIEELRVKIEFLESVEMKVFYESDEIYIKRGTEIITLENFEEFRGFYKGVKFMKYDNRYFTENDENFLKQNARIEGGE